MRGLLRSIQKSISRVAPTKTRPFGSNLPGFDELYYRYHYRDIPAKMDAAQHYLAYGWKENRDPSAGFSTRGYLDRNPDVVAAKINPLLHFLDHGLAEGRVGWQKQPGLPAPRPTAAPNDDLERLAPATQA